MPKTTGRSKSQLVGFQCSAKEYEEIVEGAYREELAVSEWIRKTLMEALRRAADD